MFHILGSLYLGPCFHVLFFPLRKSSIDVCVPFVCHEIRAALLISVCGNQYGDDNLIRSPGFYIYFINEAHLATCKIAMQINWGMGTAYTNQEGWDKI